MAENIIEQGSSNLPVYFTPGYGDFQTTIDPYNLNMYLDYGPIDIYNDDRTIAENERETFSGWYLRPRIDGGTISLYEGDVIVMYVQIVNPAAKKEYESWSCSTKYQMKDTVYVGNVFNYSYGKTQLSNEAVERDVATPSDQTINHPEYMRNGPWMPANALRWYTQSYSIENNYAAVDCTAVRQYGDNQKGFFDLPVGNTVTLNMGFRVYDNEFETRARIHRDYTGVEFDLLGRGSIKNTEAGASEYQVVSGVVAALVFSLAF